MQIIDHTLLDSVSRAARAAPRRRRNHNFHDHESDACNRLLNAIEPGSYVQAHRHLDEAKDETLIVLRGRLGVFCFDAAGNVTDAVVLEAGGTRIGVDIPHSQYHTVVALESATVFFEAKAGPFEALSAAERAPWAPAEGAADASAYLTALLARLDLSFTA